MELPLQITFHELEHSDAIEQYVRDAAAKLERLDPRIVGCRVALELPHRHSQHGEQYRVRIDVTVPGGEVVVAHTPGEDRTYEDLYGAIDAAFDDAARALTDFVRRQRGEVKPHERSLHGVIAKLFAYEGYGFLRTSDGQELYFHKNSVVDGAFARLKVGDRVRYVEDATDAGPHASTVVL
jgi:ribosomal subunit interface protein